MSFVQKVVLIIGGIDGIGALTAELFAREGASLAIVEKYEAELNAVAQNCQKIGAPTLVIKADVSKDEEADVIVKKTIDKFGKLDVLVNNAGILSEASILSTKFLKTYDEVMNINMRSVVRITYFAVPHLIKTKGNIINVSSMTGINTTRPQHIASGTSKAAMTDFTTSTALELAPHGVRVNTISPGPSRLAIYDMKNNPDKMQSNNMSLPRLSEPTEIVNLILYVASEKGKGITGTNLWHKVRLNDNTSD